MEKKDILKKLKEGMDTRGVKRNSQTTRRVYEFVVNFKVKHDGISPSLREICRGCGISSVSVANYHLMVLESEGKITQVGGSGDVIARGIIVHGGKYQAPEDFTVGVKA